MNEAFIPDRFDLKILGQLDSNSKRSNQELAKIYSVAEGTIRYRINKLLHSGYLSGLYAQTDIARIGLNVYRVFFAFPGIDVSKLKSLGELILASNPDIRWCALYDGQYQLGFSVFCSSAQELHNKIYNISSQFSHPATIRAISNTARAYHFPRSYLLGGRRKLPNNFSLKDIPKLEPIKLDAIDQEILKNISRTEPDFKFSRISQSVTKRLNKKITADQISTRLLKLEKTGIITGYSARIDQQVAGYLYYRLLVLLSVNNEANRTLLEEFCRECKHLTYICCTSENWDFELDIEVFTYEEHRKIIAELFEKLQGGIQECVELRMLEISRSAA